MSEEQPNPDEMTPDKDYGSGVTTNEKGEKVYVFGTLNKKRDQTQDANDS